MDLSFYLFFHDLVISLVHVRLSLFSCLCGCYCLGVTSGCVVSERRFGFHRRGAVFICV